MCVSSILGRVQSKTRSWLENAEKGNSVTWNRANMPGWRPHSKITQRQQRRLTPRSTGSKHWRHARIWIASSNCWVMEGHANSQLSVWAEYVGMTANVWVSVRVRAAHKMMNVMSDLLASLITRSHSPILVSSFFNLELLAKMICNVN